ncbi:uncharacterized protein JN550_007796 [Neoarthrinium moseri]|uniref:uncharacterized protein n=1 Tax=Neoarthrinium moseri TaxID=1658444 RepID=UPI001FDDBDE5|nr:uncharacterized protein JN550_007796 [Neoarthrinium moseri]KAI1866107.1 hypothetical protein JN550_007796 [Neoarthrinium moseri]
MSATVKVVSTDLRQVPIKVTPSTYLTDVLEQACRKFNLTPDRYLLKHKDKELDLSNTFRNSGLIAGAKLELIAKSKSPAVLNIALQLPQPEANLLGAPRATAKLPSDYTIWKVLRHFESVVCKGKGVNITGRGVPQTNAAGNSGQLYYETPTLQVESRVLSSFVDFQKTMSQLGYNKGNVLIRLSFQRTDKTFVDATEDISQYFKEEEAAQQEREGAAGEATKKTDSAASTQEKNETPVDAGTQNETAHPSSATPNNITEPQPEPELMEVDTTTPSDPLAPVSIFSAPKNSTPAAAAHAMEPDEVFVPGIVQAQQHQHLLKTQAQNRRLLSDRELQQKADEEAARLAAVRSIDVRVRFPDNTSAQWKVYPDWTGAKLYAAVRGVMAHDAQRFHMVLPGTPRVVLADTDATTLVRGHGFRHNTLVNLVWDDSVPDDVRGQPFLKQAARSHATEVVVPDLPQGDDEDEAPGPSTTKRAAAASSRSDDGDGKKKGVPKWLKLGKK